MRVRWRIEDVLKVSQNRFGDDLSNKMLYNGQMICRPKNSLQPPLDATIRDLVKYVTYYDIMRCPLRTNI